MKRSYVAALALCAAPALLFAQEGDRADAKRRAPEPPPKAEENAKTIAWETDGTTAATRAKKEDKRILALFFMAGDG